MIYRANGAIVDTGSYIDYDSICKSVNHRGYNSTAPENTLPAFQLSRQNGFIYVETDVQFTSDGVAVLLHDASINRTARNSDGTSISSTVNIADITYEQALTYDFGVWKSATYAGTKIPTLAQFLTLCKNLGLKPYLELKAGTQAQIEGIVDAVKAHGLAGKETYISFESSYLGYVKSYDATARLGLLGMPGAASSVSSLKTNYNEVFLDSNSVSSSLAESCKSAGVGYEVWTIDSASTVKSMDAYITGITTNGSIKAGQVLYDDNID